MNKIILLLVTLFIGFSSFGQIKEGYIQFDRKINLFKKFPSPDTQKWLGKKNQYSYDKYLLYFNESSSVFIPDPDGDQKEGMMKWLVQQHSMLQDLNSHANITLLDFFGQVLVVADTMRHREWKYTGKLRTIADYQCTQAMLNIDDSTRLYAWFTTEIIPQIGPENFLGLPGAILGIASEDGGITYFATKVVETKVDMAKVTPKYNAKKAKTMEELKEEMLTQFGKREEAKPIIKDVLTWQYY